MRRFSPRHVVRHLGMTAVRLEGDPVVFRMPVRDDLRTPAGVVHAGALATLVDIVGGVRASRATNRMRIATADLWLSVLRDEVAGPLEARGRLVRHGRASLVTEIEVVDTGRAEAVVALASMSSALLGGGDARKAESRRPSPPWGDGEPEPGERRPLLVHVGVRTGGGTAEVDLGAEVRNSMGALHGGVVALLAEVAALDAAGPDRPAATDEIFVRYLAPGRTGPVRATARLLDAGGGRSIARVEMSDVGAEDRLIAVATVRVRPPSG